MNTITELTDETVGILLRCLWNEYRNDLDTNGERQISKKTTNDDVIHTRSVPKTMPARISFKNR